MASQVALEIPDSLKGADGSSGSSGTGGSSGSSGSSGTAGTSGTSGSSGTSGTSAGEDFADLIPVSENAPRLIQPGDVVIIDTEAALKYTLTTERRSRLVAGVISTDPGPVANCNLVGGLPLCIGGMVPCKVVTNKDKIEIGDLLQTAPTLGHAEKALDPVPGTVFAKAREPFPAHSKGVIEVLVCVAV